VDETERVSEKWKPSDLVRGNISADTGHLNTYGGFTNPLYVAADSLARTGRQSKAIGDFWDAYAPNTSGVLAANPSTMISERWLKTALQEAHGDSALYAALQSLALSRASRVTADEDVQRQAALAYNTTVKNIRKALDHPQRRFDDSVLAAVMVLGTFEVSMSTT
jgi:Fungal specific transcription factor domain